MVYMNKKNYVNANPFTNKVPSAWHSGYNLIENYNNFSYGNYDFIFTKDSVIDNDRNLYNKNNKNGSLARCINSRSVFKSIGIFPDLISPLLYLERNYIKIYKNNILKNVKFDINNTYSDGKLINFSNTNLNKFILKFNNDYYLTYIEKIFNNKKYLYPEINKTMSKIIEKKYIK